MAIVEPVAVQATQDLDGPRITLRGIPWEVYEALRELPENQYVRMTYDQGALELMSPSPSHERFAYLLGRLIDVWTEVMEIDTMAVRTVTVKRKDMRRGLEPDNCYYVQNEPLVWNRSELDFAVDPPPDLAIEVERSRRSRGKMGVYAALGVPELWRFDGQSLQVYELIGGQYEPREASKCFPRFPVGKAAELLQQVNTVRELALVRSFRKWVRKEVRKDRGTD